MAIAKIEKRSATVWTGPAAVSSGIAAALGLISLLLLYGAFTRYMVRTGYTEAVFQSDANRKTEVRGSAERALSWGKHAESRELLAKTLIELNQLDAAEKHYTEIAAGPRKARGAYGLGVIQLRRADSEKDPKKFADLARKAKERFTEARAADSGLAEAQIGAANADLLLGIRLNDAGKVASARSELAKVFRSLQNAEDAAAKVTREGYIDLFVGLAKASASPTKFSAEALQFAGSARRYLPASIDLYAMELTLQAQQMAESPPPTSELKAGDMQVRLKKLIERIVTSPKGQKGLDGLTDAWFSLTLATAAAFGRAGEVTTFRELLGLAGRTPKSQDAVLASVLEVSIAFDTVTKPETNWNKRQSNYSQTIQLLGRVNGIKELQDPSRALLRAALLNNQAFLEEDYGALGGGENRYNQAMNLLKTALEAEQSAGLADGSYEVRRNMAVIQKRRGKPDAAEHFAAALKVGAARPEDWVKRDLEELQRYFAGSP